MGGFSLYGIASLTFNAATNRITTGSFAYDEAGNQTQSDENGFIRNYRYDAAGRLYDVKDAGNTNLLATYSYGASNQRLQLIEGGLTTLYAWEGGSVIAEYNGASNGKAWTKSYIYLGGRLLATEAPLTTSTTEIKYHHPDRLGTRLVTSSTGAIVAVNMSLPFGATITGESLNLAGSATKKRFTSYDRSDTTKLDYAVNRHYSSAQGRFTQVDPIGMSATSLDNPQSLNLYAYCTNDPINQIDPDGLFSLKALFGGIRKAFSNIWVRIAVVVALLVLTAGLLGPLTFQPILETMVIGTAVDGTAITVAVVGATQLTAAGWAAVALSAASGIGLPTSGGYGGLKTPPFNGASGASAINSFLPQVSSPSSLIDYDGAIRAARIALKRPQCRKLIAGSSGRDPAVLFNDLLNQGQFKYDVTRITMQSGGVLYGEATGTGSTAKVGLTWAFYLDKTVGGKTTALRLNRTKAGAVTILHELSHATGKFNHDTPTPAGYDQFAAAGTGRGSLNAKIANACFK